MLFRDHATYIYEEINYLSFIIIKDDFILQLWLDGFQTGLSLADIDDLNSSQENIYNNIRPLLLQITERIRCLGKISTESSFNEVHDILKFVKDRYNKEQYVEIVKSVYSMKSDYCKVKLFLYEIIQLSDEQVKKDFSIIFKGQYFKLLKQEKLLFLKMAKRQLPDFKKEMLKKINVSAIYKTNDDGSTEYHAFYKDIHFNNGFFAIKLNDEKDIYCKPREWAFSRSAFNILHDYFSKTQNKQILRITLNSINQIDTTSELVEDLQELEKNILVIMLQKRSLDDKINRVAKNIKEAEYVKLSNKDIKRITQEENSENVQYLFENLSNNYKPVYVNELISDDSLNITKSIGSWLFPIPLSQNDIAIVWESVKLDRATHIFKTDKKQFESDFMKIQEFLHTPSSYKRKRLNSNESDDRTLQLNLNYWCRVDHDWINQCDTWYLKMKTLMPYLLERKKEESPAGNN